MEKYPDPLIDEETPLEFNDVAAAMYALKICNDLYFATYYERQEMLKDFERNQAEIYNAKYALIEPYLQEPDGNVTNDPTKVYAGGNEKIIPYPLPETIPENVVAAMNYLDEQLAREKDRLQAELAMNTADNNRNRADLESKVSRWFKANIGADWLAGGEIVLSGCTLKYSGGNVSFSYEEINYD